MFCYVFPQHLGAPYPTTVSAVTGNRSGVINVSWSKPEVSSGELSITGHGYSIRYKQQNANTSKYTSVHVSASSAEVTGLVPGIHYQVQVASINQLGVGRYCCQGEGAEVFVKSYIGKL